MSQNRYEVLGKIADGGLGSVFKAYDRNLRREVALKRVRAETPEEADRQAEQLFEEARTLSTLQHPHIVTIFDVGRDDEGAYIVMELLKGETLEDIIERGALNEIDARELISQSLEGMISAHATGLIHLDIKPQNFMVIWLPSGKFQIKILDFGLSKIAHQPLVQETDEDGAILGSIYFMTPEQFERSPVDARTDLYSLGCVYYFALTQHYPFQGETAPEVMASHMYHSFIPLAQLRPDLPAFLPQWVEWLMSRQPEHRPNSVAEAFEYFAAGTLPYTPEPAQVILETGDVPSVAPASNAPKFVRPGSGSTSQLLKPGAPRVVRPGSESQRLGTRAVPKPLARPVNIAAAAAPKHLKPTKSLPKWLTVWTPATLAALAVLFFAFKQIQRSQRESRFEALAAMESPSGTIKDVTMLLAFIEEERNSDNAGSVLGKLLGVDSASNLITSSLRRAKTPWAKKNLANVIGNRGLGDASEALQDELETAKDPAVREAMWGALGKIAPASQLDSLVGLVAADNGDELRVAEAAMVSIASREPDETRRSQPILQAYRANSGSDDLRAAFLRVLGKTGGSEALSDLTKALKSSSVKIRTAASVALGDWATAEPMSALLEFIRTEKDPFIRTNASNSLHNLVILAGDTPQEEIAEALIAAHNSTRDNREQLAILGALARVTAPQSAEFFQQLPARENRRKPLADTALKNIQASLAKVTPVSQSTTLEAAKAELTPGALMVNSGAIINWFGTGDDVTWLILVDQPGDYEVQINQAYTSSSPGKYALSLGRAVFSRSVEKTSSQADYRSLSLGKASFSKPGHYRLRIRALQIAPGESLMRLRDVVLTKSGS
jgi:serine/threonine protein kinase